MVYDIGNGERRLVEKGRKFDDGQYHYVSFVRTGANATMRVDDFPRQYYKQPGRSRVTAISLSSTAQISRFCFYAVCACVLICKSG